MHRSIKLSLPLLVMLASCQNGNNSHLTGSKADVSSDEAHAPARQSSAPVIAEEGVWLGRKAVPVEQSDARDGSRQSDRDVSPIATWQVSAGESVSSVVRRWAERAGYTPLPVFSASESWDLIVSQEFAGSFEEALVWLSDGFQRQPIKPVAVLFANRTLDLVGESTEASPRNNGVDETIAGRISVRE